MATDTTSDGGGEYKEITEITIHHTETDRLLPSFKDLPSINREFYEGICDKLLDCAEDNDGLDVYQMTAFYKYYHMDEAGSGSKYAFYSFKSILCCLIQTAGMMAFLYNIVVTMPEDVEDCTINKPWHLKLLATLLSIYIAAQMVSLIRVRKSDGLYEHIAYSPSFLGTEWLYIGLYSNFFALITSIYGSFLIIYSAQDAMDMVLNSVALYFIMDLDVFMIDHFDYSRVKKWMKKEFKFEDYFNQDWYTADQGDVQFKHMCCGRITLQIRENDGVYGKMGTCMTFIGAVCMIIGTGIALIGAILAPIAIAICY